MAERISTSFWWLRVLSGESDDIKRGGAASKGPLFGERCGSKSSRTPREVSAGAISWFEVAVIPMA